MNRQALAKTIHATAIYYGRNIDPDVLSMMCDDLADLDPQACINAYAAYRRSPDNKTFPLPAKIREIVCPNEFITSEAKAKEVAARIVGAISKFGWNNSEAAREFIGSVGWSLIDRQGGWHHLCEHAGVSLQPTTLQAQLREQLIGIFEHGAGHMDEAIRIDGTEQRNRLMPAASIIKKISEAIKQ